MYHQLIFIILAAFVFTHSWGSDSDVSNVSDASSDISLSALQEDGMSSTNPFAKEAAAHHAGLDDAIQQLENTTELAQNLMSAIARELLPKFKTDFAKLRIKIIHKLIDGVQENQHKNTALSSYVKEHLSFLLKIAKSLSPVVTVADDDLMTTLISWVPEDTFFCRNLPDGMVDMYPIERLTSDIVRMITTIKTQDDQDVFQTYILAVQHINTMIPGQKESFQHQLLHAFCCSNHTLEQNFERVRNSAFIRLLQITNIIPE